MPVTPSPFLLQRIGEVMMPMEGEETEVEGVLNPACARDRMGQLYLFPRLVAKGNYSRIGIAKVIFNTAGDPCGVERMGIVLEPTAPYELSAHGGGCEDPRITFVPSLDRYLMTYTALSNSGPRIALAISENLTYWRRLGLAKFAPYLGVDFVHVGNKDASFFPIPIQNHSGKLQLAMLHRPLFPGSLPEQTCLKSGNRIMDLDHESIWISYCPFPAKKSLQRLGLFNSHHRLAMPLAPWENLKIGGGAPPILTALGWLLIYHGVGDVATASSSRPHLCYSAGLLLLDKDQPHIIRYRSPEPVLLPELAVEKHGTVSNVVFPTAIDQRIDIGEPNRFDVYYGMADYRIGVARLDLPESIE